MPLLSRLFTTTPPRRKMALTPLAQIPTLTTLYRSSHLHPSPEPFQGSTSQYNDKISLIRTDITKLDVDAIVNAANESLLGGGGVDGAIHRAAGPQLLDECSALDGCATGSAKITDAYRLPCKKVIHAVGPVYASAKRRGVHTRLLQGCYTAALDLASENGCTSVAFSALSTGVYGYPSEEAAEAAIGAVKGWLEEDEERAGRMERVVFCSFMEKDERAYEEFIPQFFPPAAEGEETRDEPTRGEELAVAEAIEAETATGMADMEMEDKQTSSTEPRKTQDLAVAEAETTTGVADTRQKREEATPEEDRAVAQAIAGETATGLADTEKEAEAEAEARKTEEGKALPDLPDVPTAAPAEEGQSQPKKAKLDDADVLKKGK